MISEQYRRRLEHEFLHDRGLVWVDGDGDEWVQVEGDRYVMYGDCATGSVDQSDARWTGAEIEENFGGLRPSPDPDPFAFEIAELP